MPVPPYREAQLVNGDKPITERWYIVFYCWDANKQQLVRKRDYKINQKKTINQRKAYAREMIAKINSYLKEGWHFDSQRKRSEKVAIYTDRERDFTVDQAFKFIMPIVRSTKRQATFNSYNGTANMFLAFCEEAGWLHWKIKELTQDDVLAWLDYLQSREESPIGNHTRNKYLGYISAMFTMMKERKILTVNVAQGTRLLKYDIKGNVAFTIEQLEALKKRIQPTNNQLWLFITFMLYGFIRPAEIGRLKVNMIDLSNSCINMPGNISKNRKPRHVKISQAFRLYIEQLNLGQYRPDHYVFGRNLETGAVAIQHNFATAAFLSIKREMGLGPEYTLYSFKHTGVVVHFRAGVDIKSLQAQLGHQSIEETDTYLRSLHLYASNEIIDKSPSI